MLLYIILGVFAVCFIVYFYKQYQIKRRGVEAEARVSRIVVSEGAGAEDLDHTTVYAVYRDEAGQEQEAVLSSVPGVRQGERIVIRYDPRHKKYANFVKSAE